MAKQPTLSDQLRKAIHDSGKSRYRLSCESGVDQAALSRFVNGTATLSLASFDKLANVLALELRHKGS
jgi:hypothetical protein